MTMEIAGSFSIICAVLRDDIISFTYLNASFA